MFLKRLVKTSKLLSLLKWGHIVADIVVPCHKNILDERKLSGIYTKENRQLDEMRDSFL